MPLQEPANDELRATDWSLVVLGRGYSALANCMTRLRVGTLPKQTLLVGQPDPWRRYAKHPMGQYPALLAIPGYDRDIHPIKERQDDYLSSRRFALANRVQIARLLVKNNVHQVTSVVESPLQWVQNRWLVTLTRQGKNVTVKTRQVDVCTGPGPGRVFQAGGGRISGPWTDGIRDNFDTALLQELMDGTGNRAFVAEDFMCIRNVCGTVLVVGEGPLAASVAEHALRCGSTAVTWIGRAVEMTAMSFPASKRYDNLIRDAEKVRASDRTFKESIDKNGAPDINILRTIMAPIDNRLTIVLGQVSGVGPKFATLVADSPLPLLELRVANQPPPRRGEPMSAMFDVVVVSASSENTDSERRSAAHLLRSIPKWISVDSPLIPISRGKMFAGLKVPDESLRVLGAASRNSHLIGRLASDTPEEISYQEWCDSLCWQVRMPNYAMGITVGAATIAMANEYYSAASPDTCVQTAFLPPGPLVNKRRSQTEPLFRGDPHMDKYTEFPRAS